MGQVRKDILNGWKEIGGYVCRDIRTVERWEKQRGLPVRRVPGAGRATVYALTSELDEWLENSKPEQGDTAGNSFSTELAGDVPAPHEMGLLPEEMQTRSISSATVVGFPAASTSNAGANNERGAGAAIHSSARSEDDASTRRILGRHRWMTGVTLSVAAGLLLILISPIVRGHANPAAPQPPTPLNWVGMASDAPYPSKVPGVDDLYLRGIYFSEQRTPESLQRSLDDFSAAIAKDSKYAPAYAGLANTYNLLREYSVMPDSEAYPQARAAAEHAIMLDPKLAQAHASLGFIDFFWSWDTVNAEREFRTALTLDPSSVLAHHWYGSMLTHEGRFVEAIDQLDIAQRLEPTSAAILSTRALALGLSGHRGEAMDMLQDVINETPGVSSPHAILAILSRVQPRDPARFLDEMRRVAELRHSDEMLQVAEAAEPAYRSGGETAMWASILSTEQRLHQGTSNPTFLMVDAETALGRKDDAFANLLKLAKRRDPEMIGIVVDPSLLPLRQDRRFNQLVSSVGLPPLSH